MKGKFTTLFMSTDWTKTGDNIIPANVVANLSKFVICTSIFSRMKFFNSRVLLTSWQRQQKDSDNIREQKRVFVCLYCMFPLVSSLQCVVLYLVCRCSPSSSPNPSWTSFSTAGDTHTHTSSGSLKMIKNSHAVYKYRQSLLYQGVTNVQGGLSKYTRHHNHLLFINFLCETGDIKC